MSREKAKQFSREVKDRAVRMVLEHEKDHPSRWATVSSVSAKIGCTAQTLHEWGSARRATAEAEPEFQRKWRRR